MRRRPDGHVDHYRLHPDRPMDYVWALMKDSRERIWVAHQFGLLVFNAAPASGSITDARTPRTLSDRSLAAAASTTGARRF
ncbi:MAG: hypothetical protein HYS05_10130 [Acidobacteria bacterium]|nr:hypothetical protein [Acidobacteriota bacterium]